MSTHRRQDQTPRRRYSGVLFFIPPLFLIVLGLMPSRKLTPRAAAGGAVIMLAFVGLSAAAIFGPDSDTSIQLSNWNAKQNAHGFFVTVLVVELVAAGLFALLAVRRASALPIRVTCLSCCVGTLLITFGLALALSN